ncbi:MAG: hypothetical protein GX575_08555 [Candidatus Anammoximicrobium sp.]|nr:hypothetical protein [Candidatus Anammoximicrobium sp.]
MRSAEARKNAAHRYNERLADLVLRWRRTRLILMGVLLVLAAAVHLATHNMMVSLPFVAGAVVVLFFWLDASERLREIRKRNWQRLTPSRSSHGSPAQSARTNPGAAGQPSSV